MVQMMKGMLDYEKQQVIGKKYYPWFNFGYAV